MDRVKIKNFAFLAAALRGQIAPSDLYMRLRGPIAPRPLHAWLKTGLDAGHQFDQYLLRSFFCDVFDQILHILSKLLADFFRSHLVFMGSCSFESAVLNSPSIGRVAFFLYSVSVLRI